MGSRTLLVPFLLSAALFFSTSEHATAQAVPVQSLDQLPGCLNITAPGSISGDQVIAKGEIPQIIFETAPASGGLGEIQYLWMEYIQVGNFPGQWYPILSATAASFQPGALHKTTRLMRCASRVGCNKYLESNVVTITVKDSSM